jgi:hypothetical protein
MFAKHPCSHYEARQPTLYIFLTPFQFKKNKIKS